MHTKVQTIFPFLISLLILSFLSFIFAVNRTNFSQCNQCTNIDQPQETQIINSLGEDIGQMLIGTIKKETIPEELELGDYWYWMYFEPQALLVNNAFGNPLYIGKIQINPPEAQDIYPIDDFLYKQVEVYGYQTWGYAESSVFQALSLRIYEK